MARGALLTLLLTLASLWAVATADAQRCADPPADFRPHVSASMHGSTVVRPGARIRGNIREVPVFCTYGDGPRALRRREVSARFLEGPETAHELPLRGDGAGGWTATAPARPGLHVVEISSVRTPNLAPARIRFRVLDSARVRPMALRLVFPRDRPPRRFGVVIERDGLRLLAWAVRRRSEAQVTVSLEPGTYRVGALDRHANVTFEGGQPEVVFTGSSVRVDLDGLPSDMDAFEIRARFSDGTVGRFPLHHTGAHLGTDIPAGPVHLAIRSVPRGNPWDPSDPSLPWRTLRTLDLEVPVASDVTWSWSSSALLAGEDPTPRAWTRLPGRGVLRRDAGPRDAEVLLARPGHAVAFGSRVWEYTEGWRAWSMSDSSESAGHVVLRALASIDPGSSLRAVWVGADSYAWIEDGPFVFMRGPRGVVEEYLPTFHSRLPAPCYATGIAASESGLVVVGRCRGNSPSWADVPHDGFIAERIDHRWVVRRGFGPLRAVASHGARVVAVGDDGQVAVRDGNAWRHHHSGAANLLGVAVSAQQVVARSADGALLEVSGPRPRALSTSGSEHPPHPVEQHCFVGEHLVSWQRARAFPAEGSGPSTVPDRVVLRRADGAMQTLYDSDEARIGAIACDEAGVWMLRAEAGRQELVHLDSSPRPSE